jgi:hypothetical protein
MITDLDAPRWSGREPCLDPHNDRDWWMAEPLSEDNGAQRKAKKANRAKAQELCQDCPHSSWLQCAQLALAAEGTSEPSFGVWAGVYLFDSHNYGKRAERQEAIAELKAIAATGSADDSAPVVVPRNRHHIVRKQRKLDASKIMLARQLHDGGSSFAKIGAELGVSGATVCRSLKEDVA